MSKKIFIKALLPLAVVASLIALYYKQVYFIEAIENKTYDARFRFRGEIPANKDIAVIAIDEKSVNELGRFPWSRKQYIELLRFMSKAKPKAFYFDIFFPESESAVVDGEFARSIEKSGTTSLPVFFELRKDGTVEKITENIPALQSSAKNIYNINIYPDEDGSIRRIYLVITHGGKPYKSLGLTGAMAALGASEAVVKDFSVALDGRSIPVDNTGRMFVNYSGPQGHYKRYSFSDVVKGRIKPDEFRGKILLVGTTAVGIYDFWVTPFSSITPGVEIHAAAIDNILRGDFIRRGGIESLFDIFAIVSLSFIVYLVTLRIRAFIAFPFAVAATAAYIFLSYWIFLQGMWVSMVYPVLSILLSFSLTATVRFFILEKSARQIRAIFSSYVSKKIVDELVKHPEKARVGGEKKVITIMFCDVKGYTRFSEQNPPEVVVRTLNEYIAAMTEVIMKYDGTLDKFMGDGIMAFWGAPLEQENHAELAIRCALEMLERLEQLHNKWTSEERHPLMAGIGLNTGDVIVGNIGVEGKKVEYTAIGDNVNITYRIQNMSRDVGKPVVTEALYERLKDIVNARHMNSIHVKGREAPVGIYAIVGMKEADAGKL